MNELSVELLDQLSQIDLFAGLLTTEIQEILAYARPLTLQPDAYFFQQAAPAKALYILLEGQLKVTQLTPDGQQVVMRMVNSLEIFGCVAALSGGEYPASAQATKTCQAYALRQKDIQMLLPQYPKMAMNAFQIMVQRTHELQDRYRELATECVERRLAHAVLRLVDQSGREESDKIVLDMPLSRQDLAEMIGSTLYSVSRILSQWEGRGLVLAGREKLSVVKPDILSQIAEAQIFSADLKNAPI